MYRLRKGCLGIVPTHCHIRFDSPNSGWVRRQYDKVINFLSCPTLARMALTNGQTPENHAIATIRIIEIVKVLTSPCKELWFQKVFCILGFASLPVSG